MLASEFLIRLQNKVNDNGDFEIEDDATIIEVDGVNVKIEGILNEQVSKRDIAINFCRNHPTSDIDYLQECKHNLYCLLNNIENKFEGCPRNFGLNCKHICEETDTHELNNDDKDTMCQECWKLALKD